MAGFVPLFAHPRLTADAYGKAVSRYFDSGIQVPIVIFADPTGREIPGTRLDHVQAQVKSTYLDHARKAMDAFRGGQPPEKAREQWTSFGKALRLRTEAKDPGAGIELLAKLRDGAAKGTPLRESLDGYLRRVNDEEADGLVSVGAMDLDGDDPATGFEELFQVLRDFPGLPAAKKAEDLVAKAKADPSKGKAFPAAEREHRAWLALRDADRLARDGKGKEATEAWGKVAKEFEGTAAAKEAAGRAK